MVLAGKKERIANYDMLIAARKEYEKHEILHVEALIDDIGDLALVTTKMIVISRFNLQRKRMMH